MITNQNPDISVHSFPRANPSIVAKTPPPPRAAAAAVAAPGPAALRPAKGALGRGLASRTRRSGPQLENLLVSFGVFCGLANGRLECHKKKTLPRLATGMGAAGEGLCLLVSFAGWQTAGLNLHKKTRPRLATGMGAAAKHLGGFGVFWCLLRPGKWQA